MEVSSNSKSKVLVIDRSEVAIEGFVLLLGSGSNTTEVHCASTRSDAIHLLDTKNFDVVFLDVIIPEWDGMDILSKIKEKTEGNIRLIITSNDSIANSYQRLYEEAGAECTIDKFKDFKKLSKIITGLRNPQPNE